MEEKTTKKVHRVLLNNRRIGSFGGVLDVISFDVSAILLETEQGMLEIKGRIFMSTGSIWNREKLMWRDK